MTAPVSDNPKNTGILVLPNMITDKMSIRKISGYSHEDAENLLAEFESLMTIHGLASRLGAIPCRKNCLFPRPPGRPCADLVLSIPIHRKKSWDSLIEKFREQYVPTNTAYEPALNPRL